MSVKPTPIDDKLIEYIQANFSSEDEFLYNLRLEAIEENIPAISINGEQGKFLQFLLKSINARNVLEIGTLAGYSAISMARALPENGRLISVEFEFEHAAFALRKIKEAGLEHIIEIQNSDAREFLKEFVPDEKYDFVFVDADKPSYSKYLDLTTPFIRKGGIFLADNAFAFGHVTSDAKMKNPKDIKSIQAFNSYFNHHPEYLVTIIPLGDGMIMGTKLVD